ncbi:MAG: metallophosphoesterase family protein [Burkholderiales bacterium]|nr:metallophosphoesterase family protein [Burkholderiales bacterium]
MRLAIVSDIHGNLPALQAVVQDIGRRGVDRVINLGDSVSGPLLPLQTARFLMASGWLHLAGNHERQVLTQGPGQWSAADAYAAAQLDAEALAWMATLQPNLALDADIHLCHASPRSDLEYLLDTVEPTGVRLATPDEITERLAGVTAPLLLCGHTHHPRIVRSARGQLLVNPGSVGLQAYDDGHPHWHVIENGAPDARYALVERGPQGWTAALVAVPYDAEPMARLAAQNGRPDWAHALRTGTMPRQETLPAVG